MQPTAQEYQKLLTGIIQKLIVVFGPAIVLEKAKNVPELSVSDDGTVTNINSDPVQATRKMIDTLRELSGEAVDKITENLSASYPGMMTGGTIPETTTAVPNIAVAPAPVAAPVADVSSIHENPRLIISAAPIPAPIPLSAEESGRSDQNLNQLNMAGQGNG